MKYATFLALTGATTNAYVTIGIDEEMLQKHAGYWA